jgi:class 3 adenylate cyclase/tetratricopeptide (TPR) repeat protein
MAEVGQRKTVTVLFADLVDSTAMAESIDPEALAELLSGYFTQMRSIIERHGGSVEKFIGDAVVGMFGVPTMHEDDALRAVRAALEMHQALDAINDDLHRRLGIRLTARIGVNTGDVAVTSEGSGSQSTGMALGHAINMAARLEQAAGAGEVLIGKRTHDLAGEFIDATSLDPLEVKGSSMPIAAWRVVATVDRRRAGWEGRGLFVGREKELVAIESALTTATDKRACVVVTVVAPPGMGKSRLAAEATNRIAGRAHILIGRCLPYGEGVTYAPLAEMCASPTLPADVEAVSRARNALAGAGLASPEETAWVFKQLLETVAEQRPVVAVVDDLHFAEPLLIDVLDYVATLSVDRPILLLCLSRPDLLDLRPEWATPRQHAVIVKLEPLTATETDTLLATNEALAQDPDKRREIVDAAAGVPLFAEQMAALRSEGEGGVPPSVRALLAARVDRLQAAERMLLERAAVQGEVFDRATITALLGDEADLPVGATLMGLVRREFVRPERSADGGERFRFSHALLRDAVYDQMAHRLRSQLHERFADLALSADADPEVLAHHLERAYVERSVMGASDPEALALALRAGDALHQAGRRSLARKQWQHALELLERARELLHNELEGEIGVLVDLIQAYGELADWEQAANVHNAALHSARSVGDVSAELRADLAWAPLQARRGDSHWLERSPDIADRAVEHFARVGSEADLASALLLKANNVGTANISESIELQRQAQAHAENAGDERMQIELWDELGGAMIFGPTPYHEIRDFAQREIAWARQRGIAFTEADGLLGEAYCLVATGDFKAARGQIADVRALFAQLPGFVSQLGESDTLAAAIEIEAGDLVAAESFYRRGLEVLERGKHALWWRSTAIGLSDLLVDLDRYDEAVALLDDVERRGLVSGPRPRSRYLQARAKLEMARGEVELALSLAREAVDALAGVSAVQNEARAREVLGDLLQEAGEAAAATAELTRAHELYRAKGYLPGERRLATKLHRDGGR